MWPRAEAKGGKTLKGGAAGLLLRKGEDIRYVGQEM